MTPSCNFRKIRTNFCYFLSSRSDANIATTRSFTLILIKLQNRSIQMISSRGWYADRWCVYINDVIWSGWSRTLFKDRAHFSKIKSIDWTLAFEQLVNCPEQFTGWITVRELLEVASELNMSISISPARGRPKEL